MDLPYLRQAETVSSPRVSRPAILHLSVPTSCSRRFHQHLPRRHTQDEVPNPPLTESINLQVEKEKLYNLLFICIYIVLCLSVSL